MYFACPFNWYKDSSFYENGDVINETCVALILSQNVSNKISLKQKKINKQRTR